MVDDENRFAELFDQWLASSETERTDLEKALLAAYRTAWSLGDATTRSAVLGFLYWTRSSEGFDLILESLTDPVPSTAQTGACSALALITKGESLGPDMIRAFEGFADRYPNWRAIADAAQYFLAQDDEWQT